MPDLVGWLFEKTAAKHVPLSVHIDLTMRCNERCIHCYRVIERRPELTTAELQALLGDLARVGVLYLTFSGGEVFLRPDLMELIAHARRLHFDVRLKSNALLITPAKAERLRALADLVERAARDAWIVSDEIYHGLYDFAFELLAAAHVAVTPGIDFGPGGEGYLRFSYASALERVREGLRRVGEFLQGRA